MSELLIYPIESLFIFCENLIILSILDTTAKTIFPITIKIPIAKPMAIDPIISKNMNPILRSPSFSLKISYIDSHWCGFLLLLPINDFLSMILFVLAISCFSCQPLVSRYIIYRRPCRIIHNLSSPHKSITLSKILFLLLFLLSFSLISFLNLAYNL